MEKRSISKKFMLAAGILAAAVILFSQAFEKETSSFLSKNKPAATEKAPDTEKKIVQAPSDAVISGQAVQTGETDPSFIREIVFDDKKSVEQPAIYQTILADFFKTLFRVFISPQAP